MAIMFPERSARLRRAGRYVIAAVGASAAIALLTGATGTIASQQGKPPINWEARNFALDYKTHLMHLRGDVKISQGEISIAADEAEALSTDKDSKNSHWVFTGKVHVRSESQGDLHADHATLEIANNQLASAVCTGNPAQFEQTRSTSGRLVKGHAGTIDYDVGRATVKLIGDAWLTDDQHTYDAKAPAITYNVRDQQIEGEGDKPSGGRVHVTVVPVPKP